MFGIEFLSNFEWLFIFSIVSHTPNMYFICLEGSPKIQLFVGDTVRKMSNDISGITYLRSQQSSTRVILREKDLIAPPACSSCSSKMFVDRSIFWNLYVSSKYPIWIRKIKQQLRNENSDNIPWKEIWKNNIIEFSSQKIVFGGTDNSPHKLVQREFFGPGRSIIKQLQINFKSCQFFYILWKFWKF
jgi:hypothetical protein